MRTENPPLAQACLTTADQTPTSTTPTAPTRRRSTSLMVLAGVLALLGAACSGSTDAAPTANSISEVTIIEEDSGTSSADNDGVEDAGADADADEAAADSSVTEDEADKAVELLARPMPLDGNRIYEGVADFSSEPKIFDGFDADGVLAWEGPDGIEWAPYDQSMPVEVVADPDGNVSTRPLMLDSQLPAASGEVPDAIAVIGDEVVAALAGPTERYPHGALGDNIEASAVLVGVTAQNDAAVTGIEIPLEEADVVEGISPMLADLDGDGSDEVIVTVSNASGGARLVAYDTTDLLDAASPEELVDAESDPIGLGNRWRHQIGVGATGPNGETELVVVRTPHIGGNIEWFRLDGDRLELAGTFGPSTGGIRTTSHVLRTTNLDLAALFDADGDGELEVVIPIQERTALAIVGRTAEGGELEQVVEFPGEITTNLAVVERDDGTIAVAIGTSEGQVVIWGG